VTEKVFFLLSILLHGRMKPMLVLDVASGQRCTPHLI